jgi:hypothetical protein
MVSMTEADRVVGPLRKVVLLLEAASTSDRPGFISGPIQVSLIYGLGMSGLAPLELAISGKSKGEEVLLHLEKAGIPDFFQHILIPPLGIPETVEAFAMKITVAEVSTPEQREVVRAMADMANCGSHCCGH